MIRIISYLLDIIKFYSIVLNDFVINMLTFLGKYNTIGSDLIFKIEVSKTIVFETLTPL